MTIPAGRTREARRRRSAFVRLDFSAPCNTSQSDHAPASTDCHLVGFTTEQCDGVLQRLRRSSASYPSWCYRPDHPPARRPQPQRRQRPAPRTRHRQPAKHQDTRSGRLSTLRIGGPAFARRSDPILKQRRHHVSARSTGDPLTDAAGSEAREKNRVRSGAAVHTRESSPSAESRARRAVHRVTSPGLV
jgi:hypothetical protein